ncbi:MAG: hypothetical protein GX605_11490 [Chloroflexi bacterium]|nr:hypothetical protein [Chloroflexota bacterium]
MNARRWAAGRRGWLALVILGLAAALRLFRLTAQSLWADEGNSAVLAGRSLARIAVDAAADIHPPLYYWLLHLWTNGFGTSEAALRGLSVLAGVLAVWAAWRWAGSLGSPAFGALAGLLAAVAPFAITYSQEARMYMPLGALTNLGYLALHRYAAAERRRWPWAAAAGYVFCCAAGLYMHYVFPVVWVVYNVGYLAWWWPARQEAVALPRLGRWAALQGAALALYLPWLPTALARLSAWGSAQAPLPPAAALAEAWRWLAVGPCSGRLAGLGALVALLLALMGLWSLARRQPAGAAAVAAGVTLPLLFVVGLGLGKTAYLKFLLVADGPLSLALAGGLLRLPKGRGRAGWVGLGLGLLLLLAARGQALQGYYFADACARDDYRGVADYIAAIARPGDAILLNAPGQGDVFGYYDRSGLPVYRLPQERPADRAAAEGSLAALGEAHGRLFTLFWATDESDPEGVVEGWLDRHAYKALDSWVGNVRFVIYALPQAVEQAQVQEVEARFGEALRLSAFALSGREAAPGDIVQVALFWEATEAPAERYRATVQLLDEEWQVLAQRDAAPQAGQAEADHYGLFVPFGTPPGPARLLVALYRPDDGQRLPLQGPDGLADHLLLPSEVTIRRPAAPPPLAALPLTAPRSLALGEIGWLGCQAYPRGWAHQPGRAVFSGEALHLDCYWQALAAPAHRWTLQATLEDSAGRPAAQMQTDLVSPRHPTTAWQAGDILRGQHDLLLAGVTPGRYILSLFAQNDATGEAQRLLRQPLEVGAAP